MTTAQAHQDVTFYHVDDPSFDRPEHGGKKLPGMGRHLPGDSHGRLSHLWMAALAVERKTRWKCAFSGTIAGVGYWSLL